MQMNSIFKEFENLSVEKRRFRLRWDSSPGLSIAGRLCSSVVRAVDRQSKDLGSNPSAVESVFFSTEIFSNSLNNNNNNSRNVFFFS